MAAFKISEPFTVALMLLKPSAAVTLGVKSKVYPKLENGIRINGSFKTFGGTERDVNGLYTVEKTATIVTWYRPDIKADCRIGIPATGEVYEILGAPENIDMRNQYMRIRVMLIEGGA